MKNINDIQLFKFLFDLDNIDLPKIILDYYTIRNAELSDDHLSAINELYDIKSNCKKLVKLSKPFVECMDKSYLKFTQFHIELLENN